MIDAELIKAIQILALRAVEDPNDEDSYAKICRWYSKEFSTPLHEVETLDPVYVLTHFFQSRFVDLYSGSDQDAAQYDEERANLLYPEKVKDKVSKDEDWIRKLQEEEAAQERGEKVKKAMGEIGDNFASKMGEMAKKMSELAPLQLPEGYELPDSGVMGEE